ncbi:MAG: aminoglycoside 3-N-acetyltransferase [Bryobacteraceae bacterium]|nr:aminoglycoside 3-N-acetyltransferase [Bryobacteraceae bacterium]
MELRRLGLREGATVMVHASLRALGPVTGGANTVVHALLDAVGPEGTLAAYVDVELFHEDEEETADIPVFDKRIAPAARDHGVLHEVMRNWPGALRSDHPDAGVAAIGARAAWIVEPHPFQYGYGEGTPFARIVECGGQVLMLGAPLDTITLVHHAEHLARIPDKRRVRYRRLMPTPAGPQWIEFEEFETGDPVHASLPENCIEVIAEAYLATGRGQRGPIAKAPSYLFDGADLVQFAVEWLEKRLGRL